MDIRVAGLGAVLLVVALATGLYSTSDMVASSGGGTSLVVSYPYLTEAAGIALVGAILVVVGVMMKQKRPTHKEDEREGSLGISEKDIRA